MRLIPMILAAIALVLFAACGDDDDDTAGDDDSGATAIGVTLQEFAVVTDSDSGPAGTFDFTIENTGPEDVHEFVIFKTDLELGDLPTVDDGSVDEEGEGVELIDEVEDLAVDASETLSVDLQAGNYVFICNIVEEEAGEPESHYQEGMSTGFTVE